MNPLPSRGPAGSLDSSLPVSSVPASQLWSGQRRLEGEAYLSPGYIIRRRLGRAQAIVTSVGRVAHVWMPGRMKGITVLPAHGVAFLTATQVFDVRPRPRKWLAPKVTDRLSECFVSAETILVTRSGTVGSTIMAYAPLVGVAVSDDLLRVVPYDPANRAMLYAYLRTSYARAMMRSTQYGNVIKHLEVPHLQAVPIPAFDTDLADDLSFRIDRVFAMRDEAYALTLHADDLYAQAIGPVPSPNEPDHAFTIRGSALYRGRRRLDGYHHNPSARSVTASLRRSDGSICALGDVTSDIFMPPRFARTYSRPGIPYLDSEPAFKVNPELDKFIPEPALPQGRDYAVRAGWLLIVRSGQIYGLNGSVALATPFHEGKVVSEHIIRAISLRIRPGYLATALGHPQLGRPLLLRWAFGTQIPELDPQDLKQVPVPRLDPGLENEIADHMERAAQLRCEADQEENAAVAKVEQVLEDLIGPVPEAAP